MKAKTNFWTDAHPSATPSSSEAVFVLSGLSSRSAQRDGITSSDRRTLISVYSPTVPAASLSLFCTFNQVTALAHIGSTSPTSVPSLPEKASPFQRLVWPRSGILIRQQVIRQARGGTCGRDIKACRRENTSRWHQQLQHVDTADKRNGRSN